MSKPPPASPRSGAAVKSSAEPAVHGTVKVALERKLAAGDPAPAFELAASDGTKTTLAAFGRRRVILYFYPKDDTAGCTREAIEFNRLLPEFARAGATVIGVSPDSCASHTKFRTKHALDLTLLSDEAKTMLETYGVWTQKSLYGRHYMGVERTTFLIGQDGIIARVWNKVRVPGHAQAVLEAVRAP